jgi:hypothetical protein
MNTTIRLSFVAVLSVIAVMACDSVPLTSPTGSTITLSIDRNVLPLNGQATVRAVVIESAGTPVHNGTMVTFQAAIGSTSPVEAATVNGVATVTFLAGSMSGRGFIHAFSGAARTGSGNASSGGVEVVVGAAAAGSIQVSASPSSVSQRGGTVTISALVLDSSNNPLPGVSVLFSTSSGTLGSTTALSDSTGLARTTLTTTQTATVNAIAGAAKGETRVEVSTAPTVAIDVTSPGTVGVPVPVLVTVTAGSGNSSPRQVQTLTVDFGDGAVETRTNVTGPAAFTHTYQSGGGYTITARAVDVSGNSGVAQRAIVVNRSLPTVTLTAPATVDFSDTGGVAGFTVAATAAAGQPPIQSVVVRLGDGTVIFSGTGGASFTYQFGGTGTYAVNATATDSAGGMGTASAIVRVVP